MTKLRATRFYHVDQAGFSYIEVLVAVMLVAVVLTPAIDALHSGLLGETVHQDLAAQHYSVSARMEELLAEPWPSLLASAALAGGPLTPSSFSDAVETPNRRLVYLGRYDANDVDGDGDPFTVPDPDADGDGNPFTGYLGVIWLRVEIEGGSTEAESLSAP